MNVCVIIAAAGRSERFGASDKLAQDLGGRPVLLRSVELFTSRPEVRSIIVAGPADAESFDAFKDRFGAALGFHGATLVPGGRSSRAETVANALAHVPDDATHVAVHDAARPGPSQRLLDRLFEAAEGLPAVIPVLDVRATVKRLGGEKQAVRREDDALADAILGESPTTTLTVRTVEQTIDRDRLVTAQTPQIFDVALLRRAIAEGGDGCTDDASAVESLGEPVFTIPGEARNFKITTEEDLGIMRALMRS